MRRILALLFVSIFIFSMSVPIYGSVSDLKKKQEAVKEEQKETKEKLEETTEKKSEALAEVEIIDAELDRVTEELEVINNNLADVEALLEKTDGELRDARALKQKQDEVFRKRAKYMYMNGKMSYLNILLEAKSFSDLLNIFEYISRIAEYDRNLVLELQATENLIAQKLDETERQRQEIQVLSNQQTAKMESLEATLDEKKTIYIALASNEKYFQQQLEDLESSDKRIAQMIKEAQAAQARIVNSSQAYSSQTNRTSVVTGARVTWPVPAARRISSGYGYRTSPISGRGEFHTGIDIPAPQGTDIVASDGGIVVYAGNGIRGYGNSVLVDHGNGISTFYAHCSRLNVSQGQRVERGQSIAKVGSTGYSTGPHLHYEVRVNGANTNPMNYTSN